MINAKKATLGVLVVNKVGRTVHESVEQVAFEYQCIQSSPSLGFLPILATSRQVDFCP